MEELAKRKDVINTNADKDGTVAIMDTDSYTKELNRQLSNKTSYNNLLKNQNCNITEWSTNQYKGSKTKNYFLKNCRCSENK